MVRIGPIASGLARDAGIDLAAAVDSALQRIDDALPGPPIAIQLEVDPFLAIPEIGIGGFSDPRSGSVRIALGTRPPAGLPAVIRDWLGPILAHEIHHSRRILRGPGYGTTTGEAIVTEGLADAFVFQVYPGSSRPPWITALDPGQLHQAWLVLKQGELAIAESSIQHNRWFFGTSEIPKWAGYTIGFALVTAYVSSHPGATPSSLVEESASRIISESAFAP